VLDSAATMGAYMDDRTVIRFIQELILKLQATGCRGVFPVSATEKETPLLGNIEMFMDEVSEMG